MEKEKYAVEFEKIVSRMNGVYRSAIRLRNAKLYMPEEWIKDTARCKEALASESHK